MLNAITTTTLTRLRAAKERRNAPEGDQAPAPSALERSPPPPAPVPSAPTINARTMSPADFREYVIARGLELPVDHEDRMGRPATHSAVRAVLDARADQARAHLEARAQELDAERIDARATSPDATRDRLRQLGLADAATGSLFAEVPPDAPKAPRVLDAASGNLERKHRIERAGFRVMDKMRSLGGRPLDARTLTADEFEAYRRMKGLG